MNRSRRQLILPARLYPFRQKNFDDRDPGFSEPLLKGRAYRVVRAADDEVHDLDGREDDP